MNKNFLKKTALKDFVLESRRKLPRLPASAQAEHCSLLMLSGHSRYSPHGGQCRLHLDTSSNFPRDLFPWSLSEYLILKTDSPCP